MKYNTLGRSDLQVSAFCLGSMTWGCQNTAPEAFAQIDLALAHGVNFIDTAEMYPTVPLSAETTGETERIIGQWFARSGRRGEVILASKIVGAGNRTVGRDGGPITPATLRTALEGSLRRLGTDYIDLYQLHWPNRGSYHFRRNWDYAPEDQPRGQDAEMIALLETLASFIIEGKIRAFGLSNETAWGTARFLHLAETHNLPRAVSIQNEYSLVCRHFDLDLAELSHHEDVGLLAYSALAGGLLSGKYRDGAMPAGSRGAINDGIGGRVTPAATAAVAAYVDLAQAQGLDPAAMALAFAASRPFTTSVILGATSIEQLTRDLAAVDLPLSADTLKGIAALHRAHPMPF